MMLRLLLYGYSIGVCSSRKIEAGTYEDVAFRYLSADQHPDHDTIAEFRKRHLEALAGLFTQALLLCEKAGLVKLGHVAIDGTKIKANASKHKSMSYDRMGEAEQRLKQEIDALLKQADETDAAENAQYGKGKRGDELPDELSRRETRLAKLQKAKAELEREAGQKAEARPCNGDSPERAAEAVKPGPAPALPKAKAQRNFTDAESRNMRDGGLDKAFARVSDDLRAQYLLGYYPKNQEPGRPFHRLQVTISRAAAGAFNIRYRTGYYTDSPARSK
jgi:hypothetical protein